MTDLRKWQIGLTSMVVLTCAMAPAARQAPTGVDSGVTLAVAGRHNAAPWVASSGRFVAVTWGAGLDSAWDIYVATSADEGRTFSAPVRVNAVAGDGRVSGEIPPRVALHQPAGAAAARGGRGLEREGPGHRDQDRAQPRLRPDVRTAGVAAGTRRRRRPRLARAHARQSRRRARGVARSPRPRRSIGARRREGGRGRPRQRGSRRRGDGPEVAAALRDVRRSGGARAEARPGRVLLLQDGARGHARRHPRGVAPRVRRQHARHGVCDSGHAWCGSPIPPGSAPTAGPSTGVPTTARRSPWMPAIVCMPSGPR